MGRTVEVSLVGEMLFEVSALLLSTLAWPGDSATDTKGRERLYVSLCSWYIRDHAARDPAWAERPQLIRPDYACRDVADIQRDIKTLDRRLRDRIMAGHMAIPYLMEAEAGEAPTLPEGVKRLSVNQLAEHALGDLGTSDPSHVVKKVWRPSLPVLHLCTSWVTLQNEAVKATGAPPDLLASMQDPQFLERLILRACFHEALLMRSRLDLAPSSLFKFRLA